MLTPVIYTGDLPADGVTADDFLDAIEDGGAGDFLDANEDGGAGDFQDATEDGGAGDFLPVASDDVDVPLVAPPIYCIY